MRQKYTSEDGSYKPFGNKTEKERKAKGILKALSATIKQETIVLVLLATGRWSSVHHGIHHRESGMSSVVAACGAMRISCIYSYWIVVHLGCGQGLCDCHI